MATVIFGDFEWDESKAQHNVYKHGVSFEEAATVFLDLDYMLTLDPSHEGRFVALGFSRLARMLFVVHCERRERIRIISARLAIRSERETYEQRGRED